MPYVIETYFQCIRLIRSEDSKSLQLLNFWLRDLVEAVVRGGSGSAVLPGSGSALLAGTGSAVLPWSGGRAIAGGFPEYYKHVAGIFDKMLKSEVVTDGSIRTITNKAVYADMITTLPPPKVVIEGNKDYSVV